MPYPKLILKPGREKSLRQRHPWLFSGAVSQAPSEAQRGDLIQICESKGAKIATAFYDPQSQIIARIIEFGPQEIEIGVDYWQGEIQKAQALRQAHIDQDHTNAYRLIHAEGDHLPGIIADVYASVLVLQILHPGPEKHLEAILQAFQNLGFQHIYHKAKKSTQVLEQSQLRGTWLSAPGPEEIEIKENDYRFLVDFTGGQKTGFFLDQRANRSLLQDFSRDKKVLNAFAYSGGFSVYALAAQAREVDSVDLSKEAIQLCEKNIALNFPEGSPSHRAISQDCFEYLRNYPDLYELIVLDPPAFAKNKRSLKKAIRGYIHLHELAFQKIAPQGIIFTFSCSGSLDRDAFRKAVFTAAYESKRTVRILHQLSQGVDHPVNIYHPEGEYLKGLVLQVD